MPSRTQSPIPVLVLGDWIVDEEWGLAAHESRHTSLIAEGRFRAVGDPTYRGVWHAFRRNRPHAWSRGG